MPFTVNVGPYVGGQLWAQGLQNAGQNISEGIVKAVAESKKMEEEQGADQVIFNYAKQQGLVTPEIEASYLKGSHSAKTGIIGGLVRQYAMNIQGEQLKSLQEQRQASIEERGQRTQILKTNQENALLSSEPPTIDQRTEAQKSGYDYLFNPAKQGYELTPMQGDSGKASKPSDKVMMTLPNPDGTGTTQVPVTGNYFARAMTDPSIFKKHYGVTPAQMFDSTTTKTGNVDPSTGTFVPDPNGNTVAYGLHKDKDGITVVPTATMPVEEYGRVQQRANRMSESVAPPSSKPSGTPTPSSGKATAGGYEVGKPLKLKNGKIVTFLGYNDDGTLHVQ